MPKIISLREARKNGLKFYFTGKPCPKGHITRRYTSSMGCYSCGRLISERKSKGKKAYYHPFCTIWKAAKASKDRPSFLANYPGECSGAYKRGIMNSICSHMPPSKTAAKWTFCRVYNLAKNYTTQGEFSASHSGAFTYAGKKGFLPIIVAHMDRLNSDYDAVYVWGFADGPDLVCKFGVTSQRLGTERIDSVSRKSGMPCEFMILAKSDKAMEAENILKNIGKHEPLSGFNGSTEFRRLKPHDLTKAYGVIYEHAI